MSDHAESPFTRPGTGSAFALAALYVPGNVLTMDEQAHLAASAEALHLNLDITDLYIFQKPGDSRKSILIMNVNPVAPKFSKSFESNAVYEFKVDTNGDAIADIAFRVTFSPFANSQQSAMVRRATGTQASGFGTGGDIILHGAPVSLSNEAQVTVESEYAFFAGIRSDPFFFDLMGFCNNLKFTGNDYFIDKNVFEIALEVPNSALGARPQIGFWGRVVIPQRDGWLQVDRVGHPTLNLLFNDGNDKNLFNQTEPSRHRGLFLSKFVTELVSLGHSAAKAQEIGERFLPDILTFDSSNSTGFFNGRKLSDDVVDIVMNLVTNGEVTTDMVGPHSDHLVSFPYLGQPRGR